MNLRPINNDELKPSLSYRTKAELIQQQQQSNQHTISQTHTIKSQSAVPIKIGDSLLGSVTQNKEIRTRYLIINIYTNNSSKITFQTTTRILFY